MFGAVLLGYIQTPVFVTTSIFDGWMLRHVSCSKSKTNKEAFGTRMRDEIIDAVSMREDGAAFLETCVHHTKCWSGIKVDGDTPATAFQKWYSGVSGSKSMWIMEPAVYGSPVCNNFYHPMSCPVTTFPNSQRKG